ncbi:MAG: dynamin family protein [Myxococcus sp.]|nr:dynamin family protein [Myxococcus sp.]
MSDHFKTFELRKKQVVRFGERLTSLARDGHDEEAARVLAEFMARFGSNRFLVLTVGDFKSGKSTLVNALVGKTVCPVKATPRTAKVTRLSATAVADEPEFVEVVFREDRPPERLRLEDGPLDELVAVGGKRTNEVELVDVYLHPRETILRHPVRLVDTPGIGSGESEHSKLTREYLKHADAVLFVFSGSKPYSESERDFLLTFRSLLERTVFAVNRMDDVPPEDRNDIIEHIQTSLVRDILETGAPVPTIFPVSATKELAAMKTGESSSDSGVPALVAALEERIAGTLALRLLSEIGGQQAQVCEGLVERAQLSLEALAVSAESVQVKKPKVAEVRAALRTIAGSATRIEQAVRDREARVVEQVPARMSRLRSEIVNATWAWIQHCPTESACKQQLPGVVAKLVSDQLALLDRELLSVLVEAQNVAEADLRQLFESLEKKARQILIADKAVPQAGRGGLRKRAAALSRLAAIADGVGGPTEGYGVAAAAIAGALAPSSTVRFLSVTAAVSLLIATLGGPVGWLVAGVASLFAALVGYDHASTWRERVLKHMAEAFDREVVPRTEQAVEESLRTYFVGLAAEIQQRATAFVDQLQSIANEVERELERESRSRDAELKRLGLHVQQLEALQGELADFVADVSPQSTAASEPLALATGSPAT